jgi:hypothetical protein
LKNILAEMWESKDINILRRGVKNLVKDISLFQ